MTSKISAVVVSCSCASRSSRASSASRLSSCLIACFPSAEQLRPAAPATPATTPSPRQAGRRTRVVSVDQIASAAHSQAHSITDWRASSQGPAAVRNFSPVDDCLGSISLGGDRGRRAVYVPYLRSRRNFVHRGERRQPQPKSCSAAKSTNDVSEVLDGPPFRAVFVAVKCPGNSAHNGAGALRSSLHSCTHSIFTCAVWMTSPHLAESFRKYSAKAASGPGTGCTAKRSR